MVMRLYLCLIMLCLSGSPSFAQDRGKVLIYTESGEHEFTVEIADEPEEHARGLMHRQYLGARAGMLFLFEQPQNVSFWMRNTPLPLDIIFVDEKGRIANIAKNTKPFSESLISAGVEIRAVLEVNAGISDLISAQIGDRLVADSYFPKKAPDDTRQ